MVTGMLAFPLIAGHLHFQSRNSTLKVRENRERLESLEPRLRTAKGLERQQLLNELEERTARAKFKVVFEQGDMEVKLGAVLKEWMRDRLEVDWEVVVSGDPSDDDGGVPVGSVAFVAAWPLDGQGGERVVHHGGGLIIVDQVDLDVAYRSALQGYPIQLNDLAIRTVKFLNEEAAELRSKPR